MVSLKGCRVTVVGGGVFGLAAALSIVWRGADVQLFEPCEIGDNASGVAAGMLAPAFEAGLDPLSADHFALFRSARDLWPPFSERLNVSLLDRSGALRVAAADEAHVIEPLVQRLETEGAVVERLTSREARRLQPMLSPDIASGVYTPEDWRLDAPAALRAMVRAFEREGGRIVRRAFAFEATDPAPSAIVLATGAQSGQWLSRAEVLSRLHPIKGQILQFEAGPNGGPMVRGASGYVVPQARGAMVGASMEVGVEDVTSDPVIVHGLQTSAAKLFPHLGEAPARGFAGVRAAIPDGLPLVGEVEADGPSGPRLFLAIGARRNGWLLAPMVGEQLASRIAGEPVNAMGDLFSPQRFAGASASPPKTAVAAG